MNGVVNFINEHYGEDSTFRVFDSDNVEKHVYEIRRALIIGFGAAERTIQPKKKFCSALVLATSSVTKSSLTSNAKETKTARLRA